MNSLLEILEREVIEIPGPVLRLDFDLPGALALISALQLALRHPAFDGLAAQSARRAIDDIIALMEDLGAHGFAQAARRGNDLVAQDTEAPN